MPVEKVWHTLRKRSPVFRKLTSLVKQVPRVVRRISGPPGPGFSLLANSFPKSGTHLLVQILEAFPDVANYDSFIASLPSTRLVPRPEPAILRRLDRIVPGELVSAHLFFEPSFLERLREKDCVPYFIYRDPRDVVVSAAHYLGGMNRWNRAHRYFAGLAGLEDRVMTAIRGIPESEAGFVFPDVGERFATYEGWLRSPDVCAVRYEELVGPTADDAVGTMIRFFAERTGVEVDEASLLEAVRANVDPGKSRTFRSGAVASWRETFTPEHRDAMKEVAGDLLLRLGYEEDLDW